MSVHAHPIAAVQVPALRPAVRGVPVAWLLAGLFGWLALDLILLQRFLGFVSPEIYALDVVAAAALIRSASRARLGSISPACIVACLSIALLLCALGGEGRFFYANVDWQVRDAVLRDMAIHPWPFAYAGADGPHLLRAPLGMYLVPAIVAKLGGQAAADAALLVQNGLLLGLLLAAASSLFATPRARRIALATFLAFSGLDIVGQLLAGHAAYLTPTAHIEGWSVTQFSSTITLIFWVPQHAIAGWLPALCYLLWRSGRMPLGLFVAALPLVALWSPLGAIGAVPFALHAIIVDIRGGRLTWRDVAAFAPALPLALPALSYLAAAPDAVGARRFPIALDSYAQFELIEAIPFLFLGASAFRARFGGTTLLITGLCLLAAPLFQIGWSIDFTMRASVPALAILIAQLTDILAGEERDSAVSWQRRTILVGLLAIGSITGLCEIARALTFPPSPPPLCGFARAWDETFVGYPKGSYLAPLARVSPLIRPADPPIAIDRGSAACHDRPWPLPPLFDAGAAQQR